MLQVYDQIKRMANAVVDAWDDTNHLLRTSATIDVTTVDIAQEVGGNLEAAATVLGAKTGAALDADGTGTIQQYLRGLLKAFLARIPTLGQQTAAGSVSVTLATDSSLRTGLVPTLGTIVYFAVSGTSADSGTIATAGTYELEANVACYYRVNAATAGSAAVAATAPARLLMAGERRQVAVGANGAIVAITTGGGGVLGYGLVS